MTLERPCLSPAQRRLAFEELLSHRLCLRRLREQEPGILIEVIPSNAFSDLLRREADIAIRHAKPEQPELIARLIREASACFYASEDWVRTHGHPRNAEEAAALQAMQDLPDIESGMWKLSKAIEYGLPAPRELGDQLHPHQLAAIAAQGLDGDAAA